MSRANVVLVGESWAIATAHHKGCDHSDNVTIPCSAEPLAAGLRDSPTQAA